MERQRDLELRRPLREAARPRREDPCRPHRDATMVLVLPWAARHDQPISRADALAGRSAPMPAAPPVVPEPTAATRADAGPARTLQ